MSRHAPTKQSIQTLDRAGDGGVRAVLLLQLPRMAGRVLNVRSGGRRASGQLGRMSRGGGRWGVPPRPARWWRIGPTTVRRPRSRAMWITPRPRMHVCSARSQIRGRQNALAGATGAGASGDLGPLRAPQHRYAHRFCSALLVGRACRSTDELAVAASLRADCLADRLDGSLAPCLACRERWANRIGLRRVPTSRVWATIALPASISPLFMEF